MTASVVAELRSGESLSIQSAPIARFPSDLKETSGSVPVTWVAGERPQPILRYAMEGNMCDVASENWGQRFTACFHVLRSAPSLFKQHR
ncbi:MAG: hypothetical protein SGJ09_01805 [Phycisphaerae bacterium]|nr:hypothetical protein [Phycisphaerae bacterium]